MTLAPAFLTTPDDEDEQTSRLSSGFLAAASSNGTFGNDPFDAQGASTASSQPKLGTASVTGSGFSLGNDGNAAGTPTTTYTNPFATVGNINIAGQQAPTAGPSSQQAISGTDSLGNATTANTVDMHGPTSVNANAGQDSAGDQIVDEGAGAGSILNPDGTVNAAWVAAQRAVPGSNVNTMQTEIDAAKTAWTTNQAGIASNADAMVAAEQAQQQSSQAATDNANTLATLLQPNTEAAQAANTAAQLTYGATAAQLRGGGAYGSYAQETAESGLAVEGQASVNEAQSQSSVSALDNASQYLETQLQTEIQQHTLSAQATIQQVGDYLDGLQAELSQVSGADQLRLKSQIDGINATLNQLRSQYGSDKQADSNFWSIVGGIAEAIGGVVAVGAGILAAPVTGGASAALGVAAGASAIGQGTAKAASA